MGTSRQKKTDRSGTCFLAAAGTTGDGYREGSGARLDWVVSRWTLRYLHCTECILQLLPPQFAHYDHHQTPHYALNRISKTLSNISLMSF